MSKKLVKQSSLYSLGKIFGFAAGLISYPVLTKTLTVEEYGTVALLTVTIGLMSSFIKFGVQQSIIRFKYDLESNVFSTNIITLGFLTIFSTVIFLYINSIFWKQYTEIIILSEPVFVIILLSAALQALQSFCVNLLIALEKSLAVAIFGVFYKILSLSTMLVAILLISATSQSFIVALLIADITFILILGLWIIRKKYLSGFSIDLIDKNIIKGFLIFGIPMFGYELSNMFHAFIDRFLIEYYLGRENLGLYAASYNMAKMISDLILGGLVTAILPQYLLVWKNKGKKATELLLSNVNDVILLFVPLLITGVFAVSTDLLSILTTNQYAKTAFLLPIILTGTFLFNLGIIYSAGLQIKKKSMTMLRIVLESATLNTLLNIIFIPKYGMMSAAINTIVSYFWACLRLYFSTKKYLDIKFNWGLLSRSCLYSVVMYAVIIQVNFTSEIINLVIKVFSGSLLVVFIIIFFEEDMKRKLFSLIK